MPWIVHDGTLIHIEDRHVFATVDAAIGHIVRTLVSPCAYAILMGAPESFRNGQTMSMCALADRIEYRKSQVYSAINELVKLGFVAKVPCGNTGTRHRYKGVPFMMWSSPIKAQLEAYQRAA